MKIKDTIKDFDEVCAIKHAAHVKLQFSLLSAYQIIDKDTMHKHKERPAENPQAHFNIILR